MQKYLLAFAASLTLFLSTGLGGAPPVDPLLNLPIEVKEVLPTGTRMRYGRGVPISHSTILTAAHVVQQWFFIESGLVFLPHPSGEITVAGNVAAIIESADTDDVATIVGVGISLPRWLSTGDAVTGTAWVLMPNQSIEVTITDITSQEFSGWRPFRGSSGSGMIQLKEKEPVVIGVVTRKICDACVECAAYITDPTKWECHCPPAGGYARVPPKKAY